MAELKNNVNVEEQEEMGAEVNVLSDLLDVLNDASLTKEDFIKTGLALCREKFSIAEKKKSFYRYFVEYDGRGGKKSKVYFAPPKKFGAEKNSASSYEYLDQDVFAGSDTVDFCLRKYSLKQEDGTIKSGVIYYAYAEDEDGIIYCCKLKPHEDADKDRMSILMQKLRLANLPV